MDKLSYRPTLGQTTGHAPLAKPRVPINRVVPTPQPIVPTSEGRRVPLATQLNWNGLLHTIILPTKEQIYIPPRHSFYSAMQVQTLSKEQDLHNCAEAAVYTLAPSIINLVCPNLDRSSQSTLNQCKSEIATALQDATPDQKLLAKYYATVATTLLDSASSEPAAMSLANQFARLAYNITNSVSHSSLIRRIDTAFTSARQSNAPSVSIAPHVPVTTPVSVSREQQLIDVIARSPLDLSAIFELHELYRRNGNDQKARETLVFASDRADSANNPIVNAKIFNKMGDYYCTFPSSASWNMAATAYANAHKMDPQQEYKAKALDAISGRDHRKANGK